MAINRTFFAFFGTGSPVTGKTGLTVTVDVDKYALVDGTKTIVATGASATEARDGLYFYVVTTPDLQSYNYTAVFKTADSSVTQQHIPALWTDFGDTVNQGYTATRAGYLDVLNALLFDGAGNIKASLTAILGTALTETSGYLTAAFKKFFNVQTPTAQADNLLLASAYTAPPSAATIATQVDTTLTASHGAGAWGAGGTGGALTLTYTLTQPPEGTGTPIDGATVELYSDLAMTHLVASELTNSFGIVTFSNLVAGTYYLKRIKDGFSFTNPDQEAVA